MKISLKASFSNLSHHTYIWTGVAHTTVWQRTLADFPVAEDAAQPRRGKPTLLLSFWPFLPLCRCACLFSPHPPLPSLTTPFPLCYGLRTIVSGRWVSQVLRSSSIYLLLKYQTNHYAGWAWPIPLIAHLWPANLVWINSEQPNFHSVRQLNIQQQRNPMKWSNLGVEWPNAVLVCLNQEAIQRYIIMSC